MWEIKGGREKRAKVSKRFESGKRDERRGEWTLCGDVMETLEN